MPLAELIIVLFAILAIATPFITLVLLGKYKKLRENFDQLAGENSREHASFQREVAELRRQLTAAVRPAAPVASEPAQRPAAPAVSTAKETPVPAPRVDLPAPVKLPAPMPVPTLHQNPPPPPTQNLHDPILIAPTPFP